MRERIPVAVLGATGTVGQKFVRLLTGHPWFDLVAVAASDASAGRRYGEVVRWREPAPLPDRIAHLVVQRSAPPLPGRIVFSAIEAERAIEIEQAFARAGQLVVSNTKSHRMHPAVPLLVPEVNAGHVHLLAHQRATEGWPGGIVCNPNCSTAGLVLPLGALHDAFGVERVFVATMQAVSGAGYPGVPSLDILGNVVPHIGGEEEKIEAETPKILGRFTPSGIEPAPVRVSAHTNRVPTLDGHLEVVSVGLARRVTPAEAAEALAAWTGADGVADLPSSPRPPLEVDHRPDRPQTRLDLDRGAGMAVTVGRIRPCPLLDLRFALLSHNTVRGAAGQALQIGELLVAEGLAGGG
ncbi:MAG: aspartate-semialdehyde dehydrogenase [Gemmatimonadales bacterium]|nr:aspartate-semialdehyde dehydrogenase [Gemmatimonadales bacterium]